METNTLTTKKTEFKTDKGNTVEVFSERQLRRNVTGMVGQDDLVRTFGLVNGVEVDVEPGCVFQVGSKVRELDF